MPVSCDEGETLSLIHLQGDVSISSAAEFKQVLLRALAHGKAIDIDLACVTEIDITALQLLWAAEREAKGAGIGFSLVGQRPEHVSTALAVAGFESFPLPAKPVMSQSGE
jgi:anti-anti-sigma factor